MWLMSRSIELERRSKKRRNNKNTVYRIWKEECNCEKDIRTGKKKDFMPKIQGRKEKSVQNWKEAVCRQRFQKAVKRTFRSSHSIS